ncbi:hypothetical protein PYV61_25970, partial [Roseisolibacter sp. H3M3-2]
MDQISGKLEPWFGTSGRALLPKGRKSMQLGGCEFGERAGGKLEHGFDKDAKAVDALQQAKLGRLTLSVSYSLDKAALKKLLQGKGKTKAALTELGFKVGSGDQFFIKRMEQGGTIAPAS